MAGPAVLYNRVKESSTTTGTGAYTLAGAAAGYQSFAAVGNGNGCYYCAADQGGSGWEVGVGTYTASGTTLSRDTILASSSANAAVSWAAGTRDVFLTVPASVLPLLSAANTFTGDQTLVGNLVPDGLTPSDSQPTVSQTVMANQSVALAGGLPHVLASGVVMTLSAGSVMVLYP